MIGLQIQTLKCSDAKEISSFHWPNKNVHLVPVPVLESKEDVANGALFCWLMFHWPVFSDHSVAPLPKKKTNHTLREVMEQNQTCHLMYCTSPPPTSWNSQIFAWSKYVAAACLYGYNMLVMICDYKSWVCASQVVATHTPVAFVRCQAAEFLIPGTCSDEHS